MNTTSIDPVRTHIPTSLARLPELSQNLWWSWTVEARQLFETIDPTLWFYTHHNPVKLLADIQPERLAKLAEDPSYLRQYSAVKIGNDFLGFAGMLHGEPAAAI